MAAMSAVALMAPMPGSVIRRRISARSSAWRAIARSTRAISASNRSISRSPASTAWRSSRGSSCWASQRRPATPNRSLIDGRSARLRIRAAWIWFFSRVRWRTRAARRAIRRRRSLVASSGLQTSATKPPASSWARRRASMRSVLAPASRAALTSRRVGEHHPGDVRLDDPGDGQGVAGRLQDDLVLGPQAAGELLERLGRGGHPPGRAQPALLDDRDLAEVAVDVQTDASASSSSSTAAARRRQAGTTTTTDPCSWHARASRRGGHLRTPGSWPSTKADGLPHLALRSPCPGTGPILDRLARSQQLQEQFHAPTTSGGPTAPSAVRLRSAAFGTHVGRTARRWHQRGRRWMAWTGLALSVPVFAYATIGITLITSLVCGGRPDRGTRRPPGHPQDDRSTRPSPPSPQSPTGGRSGGFGFPVRGVVPTHAPRRSGPDAHRGCRGESCRTQVVALRC